MKAVRAKQLLDVITGTIIPNPLVAINGNTIVDNRFISTGIEIIDLPDLTLLPGLIDCHTHITYHYDEYGRSGWESPTREQLIKYGIENASMTLNAGFTTIRDVGAEYGADLELKKLIQNNIIKGPRMLVSGSPIIDYETCYDEIKEKIKEGVDLIKIFNDGQFNAIQIKKAINFQNLIPTSVHAFSPESIIDSSMGGCNSIEHGSFMTQEAAIIMARNKTCLIPTLSMPFHYFNNKDRFNFKQKDWQHFRKVALNEFNAVALAKLYGVNIVMGTDSVAGCHGNNANELIYLEKAGLSSLEVIRTTTINSSTLLKRDDIGKIQIGCKADIIGVIGNPLEDLRYLLPENIKFVMKDGKL